MKEDVYKVMNEWTAWKLMLCNFRIGGTWAGAVSGASLQAGWASLALIFLAHKLRSVG